jgi:hypothetical protein
VWGFNDAFPYAPGKYNAKQGQGLDYVIAGAAQRGLRVELALANFWPGKLQAGVAGACYSMSHAGWASSAEPTSSCTLQSLYGSRETEGTVIDMLAPLAASGAKLEQTGTCAAGSSDCDTVCTCFFVQRTWVPRHG